MAQSVYCVILCALFLNVISAQRNRNGGQNRRTVSDPVSNFFNELGDLFLDVDRAIAVQTAPKVEYEDSLASQILGPMKPRKEYFNRIQENYSKLQGRLGSLIDGTISPKQDGLNPLRGIPAKNLADEDKLQKEQAHEHDINSDEQVRKTMDKIISDTRRANKFISSLGSQALDEVESVLVRRSGDISESEDGSDPRGRIIGDSLYSESRFDNYIRQLIRNHGRWVLDNPLLKRWRGSERTSRNNAADIELLPETTEEEITLSTPDSTTEEALTDLYDLSTTVSEGVLPTSDQTFKENNLKDVQRMSANYYRVGDEDKVEKEINIVLHPKSDSDIDEMETDEPHYEYEDVEIDESEMDEIEPDEEPQDTEILAFTPDGVPLKIKTTKTENPIEHLHEVLRAAGVSLKIPVDSSEDLEPAGNDVMLVGAGSGIIRTVPIDLSNSRELKSLIRALVKAKLSEKS